MSTTNLNKHFIHSFKENITKYGEKTALYYQPTEQSSWTGVSWNTLGQQVSKTAQSLLKFGLDVQGTVGIYSQNMPEWTITDFATLSTRGVVVPIYPTSSAKQAEYLINDAEISILFVGEQEQYDNALELIDSNDYLKKIVVFDNSTDLKGSDKACYFSDFMEETNGEFEDAVNQRIAEADLKDLVTLIYTSGTTGVPKGVMLDADNLAFTLRIHDTRLNVNESDKSICFLPLSHIFERSWTFYVFYKGAVNYYNKNPKLIKEALLAVRPTIMCSVPRLYEKVYSGIHGKVEMSSPVKQKLFHWAVGAGREMVLTKQKGETPSFMLKLKHKMADKIVLSKLRAAGGLENIKFLPCAGAKLSDEINLFLHALGLNLKYGYGMTETCATVCCFEDDNFKLGTIGTPMPEVEVKIGENNELMVRGGNVMKGYYKKPEATAETFKDGWLLTGDSGAIDADGNILFTERIKELMKTSGGKYIAPQLVETTIGSDAFIEQIAIIGDEKKFVSALIVPSFEALEAYAKEAGIAFKNKMELVANSDIKKLFEERIAKLQAELANYEQVKQFTLLPREFSIEKGEITPTLKVRRKVILSNFAQEIESMYDVVAPVN